MKLILTIISILFVGNLYSQMEKVQLIQSTSTKTRIINNNIDSLDRRVTSLINEGTVLETIEFKDVTYDTINSTLGYIIFSSDSIWCERPRGVFRKRLDE